MLEKEIQREIDELNALFQEQPGLDAERNEVCLSRNELTPYPLSSALQVLSLIHISLCWIPIMEQRAPTCILPLVCRTMAQSLPLSLIHIYAGRRSRECPSRQDIRYDRR